MNARKLAAARATLACIADPARGFGHGECSVRYSVDVPLAAFPMLREDGTECSLEEDHEIAASLILDGEPSR